MSYFTNYICVYKLNKDNVLLLNTLTSALDIVDNETFTKIEKMMNSESEITAKNDSELFNKLKSRGYIFESHDEENQIIEALRYINKKSTSDVINTRFTICPTMGCNLRCIYCFEGSDQHTNFKLMSDEQLNTIFQHIIECCAKLKEKQKQGQEKSNSSIKEFSSPQISLFGGEPLLKCNFHIVEKVLNFADKMHIPVAIVTNGTTMDNDYEGLLSKYKNTISVVQITVDGNKEVHDVRRIRADGSGTFESVCNGIDKFLNIGLKINLRINIDRENINHIAELKEVFDNRGWTSNPLFSPYASPVRCYKYSEKSESVLTDSQMLDILMSQGWYGSKNSFLTNILSPVFGVVTRFFGTPNNQVKPWKKTYCEGTFGAQYCFTPDGTITTCLTCVGNPNHQIGTFDENGIKINDFKLSMWIKRDPFKMEKCKKCKFVLFCGGGCPVESLENYGSINCAACDDIEKTFETYIKHIKNHFLPAGGNNE